MRPCCLCRLLEALLDRLEARGIFARPSGRTRAASIRTRPVVAAAARRQRGLRPGRSAPSLLSVQEVVFGEAIGGADGEWTGPVRPRCRSARCCASAARRWAVVAASPARDRAARLAHLPAARSRRARFAAPRRRPTPGIARRERRLEAKLARGWRPRPTGEAEVEPQPMVVTEAPAGRRCCCVGALFDACGIEISAGVACSGRASRSGRGIARPTVERRTSRIPTSTSAGTARSASSIRSTSRTRVCSSSTRSRTSSSVTTSSPPPVRAAHR